MTLKEGKTVGLKEKANKIRNVKAGKGVAKPKKKRNVFKVSDEVKEKSETDEDFHKRMIKENSKKSKKLKSEPVKLLIDDNDDLDFDTGTRSDESEGDDDVDDEDYQNFMEEMSKLDGKKHKITGERTEGTGEVSEHNLAVSKGTEVKVGSLLSALGSNDADVRTLSRRIGQGDKTELAVPLEKPTAERVARAAGYVGVKKEISVWDAVVHSRRAADQVSYPLNKPDLKLKGPSEVKNRFSASTPLEQQVAALLAGSKAVVREGEELSEIEKKGLEGLSAKEAEERKKELSKIRALQTYQEAKYRRQNKIKSKKYRKIARKERKKEELAELERLQNADPEAAAEKINEMEKMRIQERASLKHRNASKYLQLQAKRSKFDKSSKTILNEQLSMHRDMLTKHGEQFDDTYEQDDEGDGEDIDVSKVPKNDQTYSEFSSNYRKFWEEEQKKKVEGEKVEMEEIFEDAEFELKQRNKEKIKTLKQHSDGAEVDHSETLEMDDKDEMIQADSLNFKVRPDSDKHIASLGSAIGKELAEKEKAAVLPNVDPEKFLEPVTISGSELPEIIGYNDQDEEDESQKDLIAEAFADDDVVESFKAEKEALIAASKPKNIDLTLPGWGQWGGGGAMPSKRKRKKFTMKAPPVYKRRDENNKILIINTEKDEKMRSHQVSSIPFPFTSVSDYEASIRAPIGSTFIPRTAHLKMIKPRVVTKAGTVIEPMTREQLVRRGIVKEDIKIHA